MTEPIAFDRSTGQFSGVTNLERLAASALTFGASATVRYNLRGFPRACRLLQMAFGRRDVIAQLGSDSQFAFPFGDGYWSRLFDRADKYEGEIDFVLRAIADAEYAFLDCGANVGYWSVLVSGRAFGSHPALAIEASRTNHARLRLNARLNGDRFETWHRAIGSTSGQVWLRSGEHYARSISDSQDGSGDERIEVTTIDDVLDHPLFADRARLVVKVDVEGVEIPAIKGASMLLTRETLLIVEDHGSDREHTVSRFLLEETPYQAFVFDPKARLVRPLTELSLLDRIKEKRSRGYNIFATNCPFWAKRLSALGAPAPLRNSKQGCENKPAGCWQLALPLKLIFFVLMNG